MKPPRPRNLALGAILLLVVVLPFSCSGCSPVYLARAGWAEARILAARRPLAEVIADPATDPSTREKLLLAQQAHAFATHILELNAGDSYTTFTQLETDTLAWVLSAAYRDRLVPKTWWFPIVGHVPYKGYSSQGAAEKALRKLDGQGFDTYLRTTSAYSTLGWFADPLLSTLLRYDSVELVETILHELSHNHLFLPSRVQFNESFATFVGRVGAMEFFCGPGDPPGSPAECALARERWEEYQAFSDFLEEFLGELQQVYGRSDLSVEQKVAAREDLFRSYQEELGDPSAEHGASRMVTGFLAQPLNNAVLLARLQYFHRLRDFQAYLEEHGGSLRAAVAALAAAAPEAADPFDVLPRIGSAALAGPEAEGH